MERWSLYSNISSGDVRAFPAVRSLELHELQRAAGAGRDAAGGTTGFTVPVTNPFLPTQIRTPLGAPRQYDNTVNETTAPFAFDKRFTDLGGRTGYNTHDVWQLTAGTTGAITEKWSYDVYATYGRSVLNEIQGGNVRRDRTQTLLNAAGTVVPRCVPAASTCLAMRRSARPARFTSAWRPRTSRSSSKTSSKPWSMAICSNCPRAWCRPRLARVTPTCRSISSRTAACSRASWPASISSCR